jgi:hypothetical protein
MTTSEMTWMTAHMKFIAFSHHASFKLHIFLPKKYAKGRFSTFSRPEVTFTLSYRFASHRVINENILKLCGSLLKMLRH